MLTATLGVWRVDTCAVRGLRVFRWETPSCTHHAGGGLTGCEGAVRRPRRGAAQQCRAACRRCQNA
jgi:hypothetical protein